MGDWDGSCGHVDHGLCCECLAFEERLDYGKKSHFWPKAADPDKDEPATGNIIGKTWRKATDRTSDDR